MPKQITINVYLYQYDELDDKAKAKAREWYAQGALDYEWWESTYEDAKRVGLKITEFSIDRDYAIKGTLEIDIHECIRRIMAEHGATTDTYRLARDFLDAEADNRSDEDENEDMIAAEDARDAREKEFTRALLEEYLSSLRKEAEYLLSDEQVEEMIRANEYTFDADGKRSRY